MSLQTTEEASGYTRDVAIQAPRDIVFDAVATLRGLRSWWTPIVTGTARIGGHITFGFEDLDEAIVMRVHDMVRPTGLRWTCLEHTSAPGWVGTEITFELAESDLGKCVVIFRHTGLPAGDVAAGWDRFLASLTRLAETGNGEPYTASAPALDVARAYHAAWTHRDFDVARGYLAENLSTEVPLNSHAGRDDFAEAVARFGALADRVDLLAEFGHGDQALLLYDMYTQPVGLLRIAEHFTVDNGQIRRIRRVHDTVSLRSAG